MVSVNDSPWQTIGAAALLGTARQPFQLPTTSSNLGQYLSQLNDRPQESALLSAAGMVALHQRVGWLPITQSIPEIEPCPSADLPRCSPRAARCLQQILLGQFPQQLPQLLAEWLTKAQIHGQRVPEMLLPALLNKGRSQKELRSAISAVLGQRGQWLATHNSDWHYAVALAGEADWETGTPEARLTLLQNLRTHDPNRARELLQTTWSQEAAADRAQFLETFRVGLSLADEPFLEMALGDRRAKGVRWIASDLLAGLPDSRLCQQMANLIQSYITLVPESPPSVIIQLSDRLENDLLQIGFESKPLTQSLRNLGEKAGWLLQMIGATPLPFWTKTWNMSATEIIALIQQHEWQTVFLYGWAIAAQRQSDRIWTMALLENVTNRNHLNRDTVLEQAQIATLLHLLPLEQQNDFLLTLLRSHSHIINQPLIIHLLRHSTGQWSFELAQTIMAHLQTYFVQTKDTGGIAWELRTNLRELALFVPVNLLPNILDLQTRLSENPIWLPSFEGFLSLLQFRKEMVQAFERDVG